MKFFSAKGCTICLFVLTFLSLAADAQEVQSRPISTERPSVGDSPDLIPSGSIQVENGVGLNFQRSGYIGDLPETLIRVGLFDRAEIRFMSGDEVYQRSPIPHVHSLQSMDSATSLKVGLARANQLVPGSAILSLSIPSGGPSWTSRSYDPSITTIWAQNIGTKYSVTEVAGATLTSLATARRICWSPSVGVGRSLTESLTAFTEYAPTVLPNGILEYVVDGGFTLMRKRLTQFDLRTGYLKDPDGYHTLLTVGYSIRRDGFLPRFNRLARP